eukprot:1141096-Prymnesium_polylepis.2
MQQSGGGLGGRAPPACTRRTEATVGCGADMGRPARASYVIVLSLAWSLVAHAAPAPTLCPDWCDEFVCDGSTWCADGSKPAP